MNWIDFNGVPPQLRLYSAEPMALRIAEAGLIRSSSHISAIFSTSTKLGAEPRPELSADY